MTVNNAIKRALRLIGVLDPGVEPESFMQADALIALNGMLSNWSAKKSAIYAPTDATFNTVDGTASYTIGTGGDINVTRPKAILSAWVRDSDNTDFPLELLAMDDYVGITDKTLESRPQRLYHERGYATGNVYLYYTPDAIYTIHLKLMAAFTVYATTAESLALPLEYEDAICYHLAIRLAPEYERPVSQEVVAIAKDSYKTLQQLNAQFVPQICTNPFAPSTSTSILDG